MLLGDPSFETTGWAIHRGIFSSLHIVMLINSLYFLRELSTVKKKHGHAKRGLGWNVRTLVHTQLFALSLLRAIVLILFPDRKVALGVSILWGIPVGALICCFVLLLVELVDIFIRSAQLKRRTTVLNFFRIFCLVYIYLVQLVCDLAIGFGSTSVVFVYGARSNAALCIAITSAVYIKVSLMFTHAAKTIHSVYARRFATRLGKLAQLSVSCFCVLFILLGVDVSGVVPASPSQGLWLLLQSLLRLSELGLSFVLARSLKNIRIKKKPRRASVVQAAAEGLRDAGVRVRRASSRHSFTQGNFPAGITTPVAGSRRNSINRSPSMRALRSLAHTHSRATVGATGGGTLSFAGVVLAKVRLRRTLRGRARGALKGVKAAMGRSRRRARRLAPRVASFMGHVPADSASRYDVSDARVLAELAARRTGGNGGGNGGTRLGGGGNGGIGGDRSNRRGGPAQQRRRRSRARSSLLLPSQPEGQLQPQSALLRGQGKTNTLAQPAPMSHWQVAAGAAANVAAAGATTGAAATSDSSAPPSDSDLSLLFFASEGEGAAAEDGPRRQRVASTNNHLPALPSSPVTHFSSTTAGAVDNSKPGMPKKLPDFGARRASRRHSRGFNLPGAFRQPSINEGAEFVPPQHHQ